MGTEVKTYPQAEEKIYSTKEIAKRLRAFVKATYPRTKFSIKIKNNSIVVRIISSKDQILVPEHTQEYLDTYDGIQINPNGRSDSKFLTEHAKDILEHIVNYGNQWNWDNSDSMTDYFDVNFYWRLRVGDGTEKLVSQFPLKKPSTEPAPIIGIYDVNKALMPLECNLDDQIIEADAVWQFVIENEQDLIALATTNPDLVCNIVDALNLIADYELCVDKSNYQPSSKLAAKTSIREKLDKLKACN